MGQNKRRDKTPKSAHHDGDTFEQRCEKLTRLRLKFTAVGKQEWWWIMDETMDEVARQITEHSFTVLDGFFLPAVADEVRGAVAGAHCHGELNEVSIVNGKSGEREINVGLRGDLVKWADSEDAGFECLKRYTVLLGTFVSELAERLPSLQCINSQSKCMATCYPPGARYTAHVDHDGKCESTKSRRLTCILYLNPDWAPNDGGELAIYKPASLEDQRMVRDPPLAKVAPLHNRLVVFLPDWRVPHEVLAASVERYALTTWFTESTSYAPGARTFFEVSAISADDAPQAAKPAPAVAKQEPLPELAAHSPTQALESTASHRDDAAASVVRWTADGGEVTVELDVPWASSLQELELDIAPTAVRASGPSGENVLSEMPPEFAGRLDVGGASAAFSRRKRRVVVKFASLS